MKIIENPNKDFVAKIRTQLKINDGYCPCRLEKKPENKCICKEFKDMIDSNTPGMCHCGLYIAELVSE